MPTVLDSIVEGVRVDLSERMARIGLTELHARATAQAPALDVATLLAARRFSVIAEVKRSSPSKGDLATIDSPAALARAYERGGAAVISVLTEQRRFRGSLADLDEVRQAVATPILRKDFMVDEYQVIEARAHGADMILLIAASLEDSQLRDLDSAARSLGMSVLVEVHDEFELERAMAIEPRIVGVNARNLKTLDVDLATCVRVLPLVPEGVTAVAESGIATIDDVMRVVDAGARAVLVGEALVTSGEPAATIAAWTAVGETT